MGAIGTTGCCGEVSDANEMGTERGSNRDEAGYTTRTDEHENKDTTRRRTNKTGTKEDEDENKRANEDGATHPVCVSYQGSERS